MGRFWDDHAQSQRQTGHGPGGLQEHRSCRVSDSSLFVVDKSCPLLRRRRGGKFLETRIIPERIEHRIEPRRYVFAFSGVAGMPGPGVSSFGKTCEPKRQP